MISSIKHFFSNLFYGTPSEPTQVLSIAMLSNLCDESSNILVSPYSTYAILLMVASILNEPTQKEIFDVLRMPSDTTPKDILTNLRNLISQVEQKTNNAVIRGANTLWPNKNKEFDAEFFKPLIEFLGIEITPIEFNQ
ncbi:serpin family protein [Histomonas meleagridis]|uniref:serpin family protein n=1 Tax=Histomonas meleagridis TaxID=135588 RepID=UPI003559E787|nr:serpin family protein [Histomonas meleagridis]KAH0799793.1 serpin family protein [Histomonas meleagridis]